LNSATISSVPGVGSKLADKPLAWRGSLKTIPLWPQKAIDPREIMRVEQEVLVERRRLEEQFDSALPSINRSTHKSLQQASI
jgi:hypothetical protein